MCLGMFGLAFYSGCYVALLCYIVTSVGSSDGAVISCPNKCGCTDVAKHPVELIVNCSAQDLMKVSIEVSGIQKIVSLNLSNNLFTEIPNGLPALVIELDLSHNKIRKLRDFVKGELWDLKELYMSHNDLEVVRTGIFRAKYSKVESSALPSLKRLDLSNNRINKLQKHCFRELSMLKALKLSNNRLQDVAAEYFEGLNLLEYIDLSHNRIVHIEDDTFKLILSLKYLYLTWNHLSTYPFGLPMLDWLDLAHNQIQHISEVGKDDVYPVEFFNIAHNPLVCDCTTLWLKELYDRREYVVKYIDMPAEEFVPTCASPSSLAGESWDNLGDDVFTCNDDSDKTVVLETPQQDSSEPLLSKGSHENSHQREEIIIDISVNDVTETSAGIAWEFDNTYATPKNMYIQYYEVGSFDSTMLLAPVKRDQIQHTLLNLQPKTLYKACVLSTSSSTEVPTKAMHRSHCAEFSTSVSTRDNLIYRQEVKSPLAQITKTFAITDYLQIIGLSFLASVMITVLLMVICEVCSCLCQFFGGRRNKTHKD